MMFNRNQMRILELELCLGILNVKSRSGVTSSIIPDNVSPSNLQFVLKSILSYIRSNDEDDESGICKSFQVTLLLTSELLQLETRFPSLNLEENIGIEIEVENTLEVIELLIKMLNEYSKNKLISLKRPGNEKKETTPKRLKENFIDLSKPEKNTFEKSSNDVVNDTPKETKQNCIDLSELEENTFEESTNDVLNGSVSNLLEPNNEATSNTENTQDNSTSNKGVIVEETTKGDKQDDVTQEEPDIHLEIIEVSETSVGVNETSDSTISTTIQDTVDTGTGITEEDQVEIKQDAANKVCSEIIGDDAKENWYEVKYSCPIEFEIQPAQTIGNGAQVPEFEFLLPGSCIANRKHVDDTVAKRPNSVNKEVFETLLSDMLRTPNMQKFTESSLTTINESHDLRKCLAPTSKSPIILEQQTAEDTERANDPDWKPCDDHDTKSDKPGLANRDRNIPELKFHFNPSDKCCTRWKCTNRKNLENICSEVIYLPVNQKKKLIKKYVTELPCAMVSRNSRRCNNRKYHLPTNEEPKCEICKVMFMRLLGISSDFIDTVFRSNRKISNKCEESSNNASTDSSDIELLNQQNGNTCITFNEKCVKNCNKDKNLTTVVAYNAKNCNIDNTIAKNIKNNVKNIKQKPFEDETNSNDITNCMKDENYTADTAIHVHPGEPVMCKKQENKECNELHITTNSEETNSHLHFTSALPDSTNTMMPVTFNEDHQPTYYMYNVIQPVDLTYNQPSKDGSLTSEVIANANMTVLPETRSIGANMFPHGNNWSDLRQNEIYRDITQEPINMTVNAREEVQKEWNSPSSTLNSREDNVQQAQGADIATEMNTSSTEKMSSFKASRSRGAPAKSGKQETSNCNTLQEDSTKGSKQDPNKKGKKSKPQAIIVPLKKRHNRSI